MIIGILTQPLGHNYGGMLQNWALQRVLSDLGHEPITISHHGIKKSVRLRNDLYAVTAYVVKHLIHHPSRKFNRLPWDSRPLGEMKRFVRTNIKRTKFIPCLSGRAIAEYGIKAIIIGSDQVWRPRYNKGYLNYMFGDITFGNDSPILLTYAASFGCGRWELSPEETAMAKRSIKKFRSISVREDSAVDMCRAHLDVTATHLLDPTLLLNPKDYNQLIPQKTLHETPTDQVGVYILDLTEQKKHIVEQICRLLGKRPYYFGAIDDRSGQSQSVEHWLASYDRSSFVITDSFHGTAFSINYRKPFISIINHDRGADRFISLLKLFGLEDRMIEESNPSDLSALIASPIDWDFVNKSLDDLRISSRSFLQDNLS